MRFILVILNMGLGLFTSYAHDPKEAYFEISETENAILIKAEFPWTIRKALFDFRPELEATKSKKAIEEAFSEYIRSNLQLTTKEGHNINLISITEDNEEAHSHQANYLFTFENAELFEVRNQILCAVNQRQINYHKVLLGSKIAEFTTTTKITTFNIEQESETKTNNFWVSFLGLLVILIFLYRKYKESLLTFTKK